MNTIKAQFLPSLEAIHYQGKSNFLHELTLAFQTLREGRRYDQPALDAVGIPATIKRYTGLETTFAVDPADYANAWVVPPWIDANSPLLADFRQWDLSDMMLSFDKIRALSESLRGAIDLKNGRVTGVFSKLPSPINVTRGLIADVRYTPDEVAAIVMHEIGHIFTYFEKLVTTVSMNMVMTSATEALASLTDPTLRLELVEKAALTLGAKVQDTKALSEVKDKSIFQAIMVKATLEGNLETSAGTSVYDLRSCEFLADQFANRQGAGRALVTGLDKMHREYGADNRMSTGTFIAIEVFKTAQYIGILFLSAIAAAPAIAVVVVMGTLLFLLPFASPENRRYDDFGERMARVKNDMVQVLKDTRLPKAYRDRLLADIEVISALMADVKDHRTLFNYLWIGMTSLRRGQFNQMRFQQDLEKLVNNDVFVKASKLQSLAQ